MLRPGTAASGTWEVEVWGTVCQERLEVLQVKIDQEVRRIEVLREEWEWQEHVHHVRVCQEDRTSVN